MRRPCAIVVASLSIASWLAGCVDLSRPTGLMGVDPMPGLDAAEVGPLPPKDAGADADGKPSDADAPPRDVPADLVVAPETGAPFDGNGGPPDVNTDLTADGPDDGTAPLGTACTDATQCQSGACVDGVCCDSACLGPCLSCRNPGLEGSCRAVAAGADPDNDCSEQPASECGFDGSCNGAGACRRHQAGTVCAAASCSGTTETAAATCDGAGTCGTPTQRECSPYVCAASACRTTCSGPGDCKAGYLCSGSTCVVATADAGAPDTMPPPTGTPLVVDDFSDGSLTTNTMGGTVTWDNQNVALVGGEVRFAWNGQNVWNDFIEVFRPNFCGYDLRNYTKLRFRMRTSSGTRTVRMYMNRANSTCGSVATTAIQSITVTPTMTTFELDITGQIRDRAAFVEWNPLNNDSTQYFLDDVHFVE